MNKRLVLVINGKGGVGKSFFAVNFVQFLKDKAIGHVAIDSDNENSTLKRFHQRHWDDLRRREFPSFEQFRGDIAKLTEASRSFQQHASALAEQLKHQPGGRPSATVTRTAAWLAALAGGLAGYLLGRAWL
jgi:cellulose biosynthesis protein BcsQ